jgi:hypothetical protein
MVLLMGVAMLNAAGHAAAAGAAPDAGPQMRPNASQPPPLRKSDEHVADAIDTNSIGPAASTNVECDIAVLGGSTASLAAAITAAEAAPSARVCFTEITDWPGGQMTSGGVPAIDFNEPNSRMDNQPASFISAMKAIPVEVGTPGEPTPHGRCPATVPADVAWPCNIMGAGSEGACSVSTQCYLPNRLVEEWVMPRLNNAKNLRVFLRTAVKRALRGAGGRVVAVEVVQRTPKVDEWSARLSAELPDWYSPVDSKAFSKRVLNITAAVFIEATELGDVLASASPALPFLQGIESPQENSSDLTILSHCGQAQTLTFYVQRYSAAAPEPPQPLPVGNCAGSPWTANLTDEAFRHTWSWRRALCAGSNRSLAAVNIGDITQQNLGNDLDTAYLFLPMEAVKAEAVGAAGWAGGVNLTALRMLEDRAYGWMSLLKTSATNLSSLPFTGNNLGLNYTTSGTLHGLSKWPYLRDSRRAIGVDGFKLLHTQLKDTAGNTGTRFPDSVALGDYNDDTHHLAKSVCEYPQYMSGGGSGGKPYFIPFRALMVGGAPNLLVAGKLMAQSFHANSNTRLHPSEWTSGVAAGGAAALMVRSKWLTTATALHNIDMVRAFLNSSAVRMPLNWTGIPAAPPGGVGTACALQRCVGVDAVAANKSHHVYKNNSKVPFICERECSPLASYEWLANAEQWTVNSSYKGRIKPGVRIYLQTQASWLKKSTAVSGSLPSDQKLHVRQGQPCIVVNATEFDGYILCIHHVHDYSYTHVQKLDPRLRLKTDGDDLVFRTKKKIEHFVEASPLSRPRWSWWLRLMRLHPSERPLPSSPHWRGSCALGGRRSQSQQQQPPR